MLIAHLKRQLLEREAQGLKRVRRMAQSPCAPLQRVSRDGQAERELLAFCSNDYLGLANHPSLIEALAEGGRRYGVGSGASHLISGHSVAHAVLEDTLAQWLEPAIPHAQALTFCTGYMANLALLTALGDSQATLFCDQLNHASLIDGARLARAAVQIYRHGDLVQLAEQLAHCLSPNKLIVTDGVFSMGGDLADLPGLLALAERFDACLVVDDAHGFGVLGPQGRGTPSHFGLRSERLIYMGTLGKAAGLSAAFVAAPPTLIDYLVQTARPYIYSTAMSPALAHALSASLQLMGGLQGEQRRAQLLRLIAQLRSALLHLTQANPRLGWHLSDSKTAIQALIVGDNQAALDLAQSLEEQGLWVPSIRPPTVPLGSARLRITLSADHSEQDVQRLVLALTHAARKLT